MSKSLVCFVALLVAVLPLSGRQAQVAASPGDALGGAAGSILRREPQLTPAGLGASGLEGLQFADPTAALALVGPPDPNNQGTAELTYPIQIPAGRGGFQPDLSLTYSSGAGGSWLGTGWDLSVSAISIDTRWGVPRYLTDRESETYLLDGAVLSPTAVRSTLLPRVAERDDFTLRTETQFNHIIRHGDSPKTYWWEVIDKLGNHFWYGGFPDDGGPNGDIPGGRDDSAILKDDQGNAYRWALSAKRDVGVNVVRYFYETVSGQRVGAESTTLGKQLYLKSIHYTEAATVSGEPPDPPYEIRFLRDGAISPAPTPRKDVIIDARGGFLEVTSDLLRRIEVWYGAPNGGAARTYDTLVKRYSLNYVEGAFGKSLLRSVDQAGADGVVYATHLFDYYDDVRNQNGAYNGFADAQNWNTGNDSLEQTLLGPQDISALGASETNTGDFHMYVGFNLSNPTKTGSFGGSLTIKGGATEGLAEFLDINGDGLPDKVFRKSRGGAVMFRLNTSGPDGGTTFDPTARSVTNLNKLSTEWDIGLAGALEAYFGVSVQFSVAGDVTVGEDYFTDVNADGLPDFVSAGQVYFNHLENGIPTFSTSSSLTTVPIDDGTVNLPQIQQLADLEAQQRAQSPLQDTVHRWVAPFTGTVRITGAVTFSPPAAPNNGIPSVASDGVRVAIQYASTELWAASLVTPGQSVVPANVNAIAVSAGQAIYFRVGSVDDGAGDQVLWDPTITYTNLNPPLDVNGLSQKVYKASDDFTLAGRPGSKVFMPLKGTVKFDARLRKTAATSDDVTVIVLRNGVPVITNVISAATVNTSGIDVSGTFDVAAPTGSSADQVEVRIAVDSPIDVTVLEWEPRLYYTSAVDQNNAPLQTVDANGNPILEVTVPADIDVYPNSTLTSPSKPWTSTLNRTVTVHAEVGAANSSGGEVVLTVKTRSGLVAKRRFTVPAGVATVGSGDVDVALQNGQDYWFDLSIRDPALSDKVTSSKVILKWNDNGQKTQNVPSTRYWAGRQGIFPISYRGWGYAGYKADGAKATAPINQSAFVINTATMPQANPTGFNDPNYNNPAQADAFAYVPYLLDILDANGAVVATKPVWRGSKDNLVGGADFVRSSRLGADSPSLVGGAAGSGQRAIRRVGVTAPVLGIVGGLGPLSASFAAGPSFGLLDYVDLNGDGFPDVVAPGYVSYTGPRGGYYDSGAGVTVVGQDVTFAVGGGFAGSAVEVKGNSKGNTNTAQTTLAVSRQSTGNSAKSGGSASQGEQASGDEYGASIGFGVDISASFTNPSVTDGSWDSILPNTASLEEVLADVNGDGLPDKVSMNPAGVRVRLNLGYTFMTDSIPWSGGGFEVNESFSGSLSPGLGFQINNKEFSGGLAYNESVDLSRYLWVDLNGDGVLDRLRKDGTTIKVAFGSGAGILSEVSYGTLQDGSVELIGSIPTGQQLAQGRSRGLGGGADFTIGIGPLCLVGCYLILNPGAHFEHSVSWNQVQLVDVDGDGAPDSVRSDADDAMSVRLNTRGRTNLLKSVSNPLGGEMRLDYARDGNTTAQPYSQWNLARVEVDDNRAGDGPDTLLTTYEYSDNRYNPLEREFLGYALVVERQRAFGVAGEPILRSTERAYLNGTIFESGLMTRETLLDPSGAKLRETLNTWRIVDLATKATADLGASGVVLLGKAMTPELTKVEQRWFTGGQMKNTWTTFTYDDLGNAIQIADIGEPGVTSDDLVADITYTNCQISSSDDLKARFPCLAPAPAAGRPVSPYWNANRCPTWTSLPAKIEIRDGSGAVLRSRDGSPALCDNSSVTELTEQIGDGTTAVTLLDYDEWGSYAHIEYPEDANGERYIVDYVYDPDSHANIARTEDSRGLVSTATFDGRFGLVTSRVDANGQRTSYTYDVAGRLASVTVPYEQGTGKQTIRYEYHPTAAAYAYAIARHFDVFNPGDTINTATFVDGIGRTTQTKQDATFFRGAGSPAVDGMIVSGAVEYDALGRPVKEWYPIEELAPAQIGTYNTGKSAAGPTMTTYDLRDLVTRIDHPDGSFSTNSHTIGSKAGVGDNLFLTQQVDEEGHAQDTYSDVRDNVLGVEVLPGGSSALLTRYRYNGLGELLSVLDSGNNTISYTYDMLGRSTSTNTPDGGLIELRYDGASNLIQKVTPNLRARGQAINYRYALGQLVLVDYPDATPDVTYTYGGPGAANNGAGRVIAVHDAARDQKLKYGRMGEVTSETTTMLLHNLNDGTEARLTFTTRFVQDSFGRYKTVTYPDGEVLTFDYDAGGLVNRASGQKGSLTYPYIERREYDEFLARRFDKVGNGVQTETSYNALTRRLARIQSLSPTIEIQDLNYTYDRVGNVLKVDNQLPPPKPSLKGGPSVQTFTYDQYYRLVSAKGTYDFAPGKQRKYTDDLVYNSLGNLISKAQTDVVVQGGGKPITQQKTTYTFTPIQYTNAAPHQVARIGTRPYTYDLNGNFTGWTDDATGQRRTVVWDAADRAVSVADQGATTTDTYDESNRLAIERGPAGETAFVNQWYTVRNGTVAYKHIWVGDDRVATQRVFTDGTDEFQRYFLHKDLEQSTNIVTDPTGKVFEHFEYFPGGEIWVLEHGDEHRTPYTFAGGYWDEVRQLLNLGQRWYESREQFFYSPDPVLVDDPTRVIDDAALLAAYTYAEANPLRLVDRDGRAPEDVQSAFRAAFSRPDGSLDTAKLAAFTSTALRVFNRNVTQPKPSLATRLGKALGISQSDPAAARKKIDALTERFGDKPLVSISLTKTTKGIKVESVTVSPLFAGPEFTVFKKKGKP